MTINPKMAQPLSRFQQALAASGEDPIDLFLARDHTDIGGGVLLAHHALEQCSGSCCLHGTSPYITCALPKTFWIS